MKTTKEKGFEVSGSGCSEYRHVTVRVVQLKDESSIRNWLDDWHDKWSFQGLTISCQMDSSSLHPYGWDITYKDVYTLTLADAQKKVKTLRSIQTKMGNYAKTRGEASTYGEYASRVGEAIGITSVVKHLGGEGPWYNDQTFHYLPIGDIRYLIAQKVSSAMDELGHKKAA